MEMLAHIQGIRNTRISSITSYKVSIFHISGC